MFAITGQYGNNCIVFGYGGLETSFSQQRLKQVTPLPIVNNEECFNLLKENTILGNNSRFYLHESFLCAGGMEGVDSTKGDGGGSLVCPSLEDPDR